MGQNGNESLLSYRMTTTHSCGPDAVAFVLGANKERNPEGYEAFLKLMNWPNTCDWRDNARDYVGSHFRVLDSIGMPHRIIKVSDILSGNFIPGRVVALLHDYPDRNFVLSSSQWIRSVLNQHWVVIQSVDGINAIIHDGTGKARSVSVGDLKYWLTQGSPSPVCAYVIGEGRLGGYYLERLWDVFASAVVHAYTWIVGK